MDGDKRANLFWVGAIAFFALLLVPAIQTVFIEPLRSGHLLMYYSGGVLKEADFVNFYYAGFATLKGAAPHAYDYTTRLKLSNELVAPYSVAVPLYCGYLPFVFPLMVPFALLPLVPSFFCWCGLTFAFGTGALAMFLRRVMGWQWRATLLFCLIAAVSLPAMLTFALGQVVWLLVGLEALFFWGLLKGRAVMGGVALGFSAVKPQYTLVWAAAALGMRRWKLLAIAVLTDALLFASAIAVMGWHEFSYYPAFLQHTETADNVITVMMSVRPLLALVLPHAAALRVNLLLLFGAMALVAWMWHRYAELEAGAKSVAGEKVVAPLPPGERQAEPLSASRQEVDAAARWLVILTVVSALVFSPHTHCHDALLLAVAACMPAYEVLTRRNDLASLSWTVLIATLPLLGYPLYALPNSGVVARWPFILYDAVLFAIPLVWLLRHRCAIGDSR